MTTATFSPAVRANASETYEECRKLIYSTVWSVIRQYGGDFDDLMSEANVAFLDAYESFDGSSAFTSWVYSTVWYRCVDFVGSRLENQRRFQSVEDDTTIPDRRRSSWRINDMLEELGEDARLVVKLTIETPAELARIADVKGGQARNLRSSLRQYLADMGWTAVRIAESFCEVQRALSE